ncbi:MAG: translocation/assembly module TamB domain-containing protein, partial [Prevotellaceae bacterium]|nr:translocation/assembly module TamB domain-containing protein [Prevotellaceae bacterium]
SNLYCNFTLNVDENSQIRVLMDNKSNDYITLYGNGTLKANYYNKGKFGLYGTYNVSRGDYSLTLQNILKKDFQFQDGGSIVFGGDPYDAIINLQALYTVNNVSLSDLALGTSFTDNTIRVNCLMNITGQPKQPKVNFDLDLPTVNSDEKQMIRSIINSEEDMNQQVVYLLGIGRFYTRGVNNADQNASRSQTTLAMQSLLSGTISSQLNTMLSQVLKTNNWNFGANISTGTEGWENA